MCVPTCYSFASAVLAECLIFTNSFVRIFFESCKRPFFILPCVAFLSQSKYLLTRNREKGTVAHFRIEQTRWKTTAPAILLLLLSRSHEEKCLVCWNVTWECESAIRDDYVVTHLILCRADGYEGYQLSPNSGDCHVRVSSPRLQVARDDVSAVLGGRHRGAHCQPPTSDWRFWCRSCVRWSSAGAWRWSEARPSRTAWRKRVGASPCIAAFGLSKSYHNYE